MYGLPDACTVHALLAKADVWKALDLSKEKRTLLDNEIKRFCLIAEISPASVHINAGREKQSIFLVQADIKNPDISPKLLELIAKGMKQPFVYLLINPQGKAKTAIYEQKLFHANWQNKEDICLTLHDLDQVWQNLVLQIGAFALQNENCLAEQISLNEEKERLLRQISLLEKKRNKEAQPRKKLDLHRKIQELQAELQNYI